MGDPEKKKNTRFKVFLSKYSYFFVILLGALDDLKINEKVICAFEMFENSNKKISVKKF